MDEKPDILIDVGTYRRLLADWFVRLCLENNIVFPQRGMNSTSMTFGDPTKFHVSAHYQDELPFLYFEASDKNQQGLIERLSSKARLQADQGNLGELVWYSATLAEPERRLSGHSMLSYAMSTANNKLVIDGWRTLGSNILLEFKEVKDEIRDGRSPIARTIVNAHVAVPAPYAGGDIGGIQARYLYEMIEAICTIALGREIDLPPHFFPSDNTVIINLNTRRADVIHGLARRSITLDIFEYLPSLGDIECHQRTCAALMTFSAAMRQERDPVACMLYVVAAEALTTPLALWKTEKLTKRFKIFFEQLLANELDNIINSPNFEEVFNIKKGKRSMRAIRGDLLDKIYSIRSGLVHQGLWSTYGFGLLAPDRNQMRILLQYFAEMAILRFIECPRVSCVGHPGMEAAMTDSQLGK